MDELKPCQFCGGEAETIQINGLAWLDKIYIVQCANPNCEVSPSVKSFDEKKAIEAWNRRAEK